MIIFTYLLLVFSVVTPLLFIRLQVPLLLWAAFICSIGVMWLQVAEHFFAYAVGISLLTLGALLVFITIPVVRRTFITNKLFTLDSQINSKISGLERQALAAGQAGFEAGFFTGTPDWSSLHALPGINLSKTETTYVNDTIDEYCTLVDDWEMRNTKNIPQPVWDFAEKHRFSGLRVLDRWGGGNFSFQAQSLVLSKAASRSVDASILIEMPTSLYPDELIEEYGTQAQKEYYLPRLANGQEIVSLGVTSVQGSDVGSMPDSGVVGYGEYKGKRVLGVTLNFSKRYITFAPKSSLLVLAFSLSDPDNLLTCERTSGISLALIPTDHPGIDASKRHYPAGLAFPNGPIVGKNVFIPIDWIVGAEAGIGLGWKMIVQCLFVGRALALPSISVGSIKAAFRTTIAYASVRRQFGLALRTFESIQKPIAQLTELVYKAEAGRSVTAALIDSGVRPLAVSGIMKYQLTEYGRQATDYALDVHAGRAICDGPSNYLLSAYNAVPIGITVEGANIVTRSVITFAQGALQSHPYLRKEIESRQMDDKEQGLRTFDNLLRKHVRLFIYNCARAIFHNLTFGWFVSTPKDTPATIKKWCKQINRYSISFAIVSDVTILLMGTTLKKQQQLGGRLADILSELYLLSATLKRYQDDSCPPDQLPIVQQVLENGFYTIQTNLITAITNFPNRAARPFLHVCVFTLGAWGKPAADTLVKTVATTVLDNATVRDQLSEYCYVSTDPEDITGKLEVAFKSAIQAEPIYKKIRVATRAGLLVKQVRQVEDALQKNVISESEAAIIRVAEVAAAKAVAVDSFDQTIYHNPLSKNY